LHYDVDVELQEYPTEVFSREEERRREPKRVEQSRAEKRGTESFVSRRT